MFISDRQQIHCSLLSALTCHTLWIYPVNVDGLFFQKINSYGGCDIVLLYELKVVTTKKNLHVNNWLYPTDVPYSVSFCYGDAHICIPISLQ